jgi:hypothetical protein
MDIDVPRSQLAQLGDPQAGLGHHGDHRAAADLPVTPSAPVHVACRGEQLNRLIRLEHAPHRAGRFEPAALAACTVRLEASPLDCGVENVRQQHERLVDALVAQRNLPLPILAR